MNRLAQFLLLATTGSILATARAQEPGSVLRQVEKRVKPVLAGLHPTPTLEYAEQGQSFIVRYHPQKFLVHQRSKTGAWSTNVVEELGPSFTGFVLRIHLERLGEVNQAVTPRTMQEPYWQTLLDVTPIAGTTNQIYWALSFAGGTDERLLTSVREALESLGRLQNKPEKPRLEKTRKD
jgi:hypothetical protein